jgi:general secretion pathway protein K
MDNNMPVLHRNKSCAFTGKRQRGVAIITALLIVTIATTVSIAISTHLQLDIRRTSNLIALDQADFYALFAEDFTKKKLQDTKNFDDLMEALAQYGQFKQEYPVEGGFIEGKITDLNSCINVNALVNNNKLNPTTAARLTQLFSNAQITGNLTDAILDWIDSGADDQTTTPNGAEDGYYMNLDKPYRTANTPLHSISELRLIKGFENETSSGAGDKINTYDLIVKLSKNFKDDDPDNAYAPSLCAFTSKDGNPSINVNTASAEVLQSLSPDMTKALADSIIEQRKSTPFSSISEFTGFSNLNTIIKNTDYLSTSSDYFLLKTKATIGQASKVMYSIIYRDAAGKTEVVYRTHRTL